jgi:hypothetical protein
MIGLGDQIEGLYRLALDSFNLPLCNNFFVDHFSTNTNLTIPSSALWHFRLCHVSHKRLSHMSHLYPSLTFDHNATCDIFHFAKQKKLPFPSSLSVASKEFELLHFDIWGPLSTTFVHNHRYFLIILDDYSRFVWIIVLKSKCEVSQHVKNFISLIETQFHITPKAIQTDNGPEFLFSITLCL